MKIQCDVDERVWRAARMKALAEGKTMGELVTVALDEIVDARLRADTPSKCSVGSKPERSGKEGVKP
jgi:hypothetical protein